MLHAIILICSLTSPTCERATAIDYIVTPIRTALPTACFLQAQEYVAGTVMGRSVRADEIVRIVCERDHANG